MWHPHGLPPKLKVARLWVQSANVISKSALFGLAVKLIASLESSVDDQLYFLTRSNLLFVRFHQPNPFFSASHSTTNSTANSNSLLLSSCLPSLFESHSNLYADNLSRFTSYSRSASSEPRDAKTFLIASRSELVMGIQVNSFGENCRLA